METYLSTTCEETYWKKVRKTVEKWRSVLCREETSCNLQGRMSTLVDCAYVNAEEDVSDNPYYLELNAHYYLATGRILAEDYDLPAFDWAAYHALREQDGEKARKVWEAHEEEKRRFFLSVAERLWNFSSFSAKYRAWLTQEETEQYHEYCQKIFLEDRIFLLPEWLLFSCNQWRGKQAFLYQNPRVDYFLHAHGDSLSLLPKAVFEGKAFLKRLSKKKGKRKINA